MTAQPQISFEFFPPKTEAGRGNLLGSTAPALLPMGPAFFSVTYGAGGSTRDNTLGTVLDLAARGMEVAPHLSFGNDDAETISGLLDAYRARGIRRIVALRGDVPGDGAAGAGRALVHASDLVAFIRAHSGDHFEIAVAAYPEIHPLATSYDDDVRHLRGKFDAGADSAITQYFFNVDAYLYFIDQCRAAGIERPIHAGIMPIANVAGLARFSQNCGAEIPRWILRRLEGYGDDEDSIRAFGIEVVTRLCETLLENGAPGLHFFTLNQIEPTRQVCLNLGLEAACSGHVSSLASR
jgi:methylenetetrahydrofolate reductase (NADPH)